MILTELRDLIDKRLTQRPDMADMPIEVRHGRTEGLHMDGDRVVLTIKEHT